MTPKPRMIVPETRFTQCSASVPSLERNKLVPPLKKSHHSADPENTPATSVAADAYPALVSATPSPAKMAAKEKMVRGLVIVKKNVVAYAALASFPEDPSSVSRSVDLS